MTYNNYRRFKVYLFGVVEVDFVPCYKCAKCKAQMRNIRVVWRLYPDKMPTGYLEGYDLGKKVGHVEVVRMLRRLFDEQVKHALGTDKK